MTVVGQGTRQCTHDQSALSIIDHDMVFVGLGMPFSRFDPRPDSFTPKICSLKPRTEKAPAIAGRGKLAERSEKQGIRPCPLYTLVGPNIP